MIENIVEGTQQVTLFFGPCSRNQSVFFAVNVKTRRAVKLPKSVCVYKKYDDGSSSLVHLREKRNTHYLPTNNCYIVSFKGRAVFKIMSSRSTYAVEKIIEK
jgi:hypothetical protein